VLALVALGVGWIGLGGIVQSFEVRGVRGSRLDLWRDMLPMVPRFPVFGNGWNAFATAYPWYQTVWKTEWIGEAHNDYLQALFDGGVVGLALVCGLLALVFRAAFARARRSLVDLGLLGALLGLALHELVDFGGQIPANAATGIALAGAVLDVWQADADGAYEAQLEVDEARLRAKYRAREDGTYCIRSIVPLGYAIPMDGPVGDLIARTDISNFRPSHIHFLLEEDGYERLVTHLFAEGTDHLEDDVVFGTKAELVTPFVHHEPGPAPDGTTVDVPFVTAHYDFVLQPTPA